MIGLRIGAAELAEIEAGAPCIVLAPGVLLPHAPPLVPLRLQDGVLARPGADTGRTLPLPPDFRPLALIAPEDVAAALAAQLPADIPTRPAASALPGLLAAGLAEEGAARRALLAERDRLRRALPALGLPRPRLVLETAPGPARAAAPLTQPLGRPAEGLCTVELHVAAPGGALRARLCAGDRVLGQWTVPAAAITPGWLALDLPEPAPPGPAEAVLELLEAPMLSAAAVPPAALGVRLWTAEPGWSVLPRFLDWQALGARRLVLPLPLPRALLAEAEAEGATAELVAIGEEAARLVVDLPAGGTALLRLPPFPVGPADLLRARVTTITGPDAACDLRLGGPSPVSSGDRPTGRLPVLLPLPPGPMAELSILLRNPGEVPASIEIAELALLAGAAGEARQPPAPEDAPRRPRIAATPPGLAETAWRAAPPAPRMGAALPGGGAPLAPSPLAVATAYQDLAVNQHLANADGTYHHLDLRVAGLVSGGGLWRQLRLKLFERRGVVGLEFREMKGWPPMFDIWPSAKRDNYGPFWRLETEKAGDSLAGLATPHDRALVAALIEVLPDLASRGARLAGLTGTQAEAWPARARRLEAAVALARGG